MARSGIVSIGDADSDQRTYMDATAPIGGESGTWGDLKDLSLTASADEQQCAGHQSKSACRRTRVDFGSNGRRRGNRQSSCGHSKKQDNRCNRFFHSDPFRSIDHSEYSSEINKKSA
jgi:hypothetical protein